MVRISGVLKNDWVPEKEKVEGAQVGRLRPRLA